MESSVAVTLQEVKTKYKEVLVIDCPPEEELPPGLKVGNAAAHSGPGTYIASHNSL